MYSIWFLLFMINIINTTNLRCNEDVNGSLQLVENCRACVIFIDTNISTIISPRNAILHDELSIEELFLYDEKKHRRRRRYTSTVIHQKCDHELDGPIYGYDQTHCYCNSNQCNSNIQRCIYEIASKRYFSCYHGTNSSHSLPEIARKCRSCRIRIESNSIHHYECLTFGEQEQKNNTHCTCQHPMCNQDFSLCQRFHQIPSQPRVHAISEIFLNTTITYLNVNSTNISNTNQIEREIFTENSTLIQYTLSSFNETKTILVELKNHGNYFSWNFSCLLIFFIYYM